MSSKQLILINLVVRIEITQKVNIAEGFKAQEETIYSMSSCLF